MKEHKESEKIMRTYRFYPDIVKKLQELSTQEHRSNSNMIEFLIETYYQQNIKK